jgi:hypothetical protein
MTASLTVEDETDWEEESDGEDRAFSQILVLEASKELAHSRIRAEMSPRKLELVERLMDEFWVIFKRNRSTIAQQRGNTPDSTSPSTSATELLQSTATEGKKSKRQRDSEGDEDDGEKGGKGFKRPGGLPQSTQNREQSLMFACPYRKHNPRKYCVADWSPCAITPQKTVARVK